MFLEVWRSSLSDQWIYFKARLTEEGQLLAQPSKPRFSMRLMVCIWRHHSLLSACTPTTVRCGLT